MGISSAGILRAKQAFQGRRLTSADLGPLMGCSERQAREYITAIREYLVVVDWELPEGRGKPSPVFRLKIALSDRDVPQNKTKNYCGRIREQMAHERKLMQLAEKAYIMFHSEPVVSKRTEVVTWYEREKELLVKEQERRLLAYKESNAEYNREKKRTQKRMNYAGLTLTSVWSTPVPA